VILEAKVPFASALQHPRAAFGILRKAREGIIGLRKRGMSWYKRDFSLELIQTE
jgi:hypothetical protein